MERGKTLRLATLVLFAVVLAGCGEDDAEDSTDMTNPVQPAPSNIEESEGEAVSREMDVGEESAETQVDVGNAGDVSTGMAGTTSGITGSDMVVPDETMDEGWSSRDQMPVSDPAAQDMQPNESTPEEQAPGSPSAGGGQGGVPQASSSSNSQTVSEP